MEFVSDNYKQLVCESAASYLANKHSLNKKEQRYLAYMLNDNNSMIIGDMLKELKTTVITLLGNTRPSLFRKLGDPGSEEWDKNIREAIDSGEMPQIVERRHIDLSPKGGV